MKIYHTETQSDYDALMIKLEAEGSMWHGEGKPTSWNGWSINSNETCVIIRGPRITQACLISCKNYYPKIPIIKYKAKAEDKMKFTEDNVNKLFSKYRKCADYSLSELQDEILKLDDKLEKVFAPKSVALFYENVKHYKLEEVFNQFEKTSDKEVSNWYFNRKGRYDNNIANAQETIAKMHLYGYEIEKEPQYIVSIMDMGIDRIILIKNWLGYSFELESEIDVHWEVHFTEQQIKEYDKRYWAFAVPVEGKE
ncbi:DUF1642 domain-containing protein [Jeotgalibaca porci]|uniref:DUF1642 domain-containing protein n=1 Tax=Jeotgalibaca porci TaxID=1868793 RepID=UPI00359FC00C